MARYHPDRMTEQETGNGQSTDTQERESPLTNRQLTGHPLALAALGLLGAGVLALTLALDAPPATPAFQASPSPASTPFLARLNAAQQSESGQRLEREAVAFTTLVPSPTPFLTPTLAPVTPIPWTEHDFNALTWLCYEEVRGMREARYDACLSVISTVRRRYAYEDDPYHEDTIEETLLRENQFPIDFDLNRPAPDDFLQEAVYQYQWGARGSCTGYLYYDSIKGGPSLCVIRAANGQFVEFHDGWR